MCSWVASGNSALMSLKVLLIGMALTGPITTQNIKVEMNFAQNDGKTISLKLI